MDTLDGMRVFARVVDSGSFSEAARRLGLSKALVSKYVGQLEGRLGVRLLNRTTRRLSATEAGRAYYQRCADLVDQIDDLERAVQAQHAEPRGHLRIAGSRGFGEEGLTRCVDAFLARYPEISVDLDLSERQVDIIAEGFDLAVRMAGLPDSSLIVRKILDFPYILCASPDYLAQAGTPQVPGDLAHHHCIVNRPVAPTGQWQFLVDGQRTVVFVRARIQTNTIRTTRYFALRHYGIALLPLPLVADALDDGRLVRVLQPFEAYDRGIYVLYPHNRFLSAKVRCFVDHMADYFRSAG
ncbi:MAG: LysR family transcriptional regulator [Rhodospirillaceae bacterium]|nr:LysR family transcriptional regulator [Rhodospirillaceae bacterium]